MPELHRPIEEIEARISIVRQNLLELTEEATGDTGAAFEEHIAEEIAKQEEELKSLEEERDAIRKGGRT
ncbi:MAG: hypothetical protein BGN87_19610 [Rhizobiales bacterium 65-79]|jgi:hypothetical protein|nr:hypothetical protein [Hyphomicrobiales bacterium]OJU02030.1 MAG: hypothetical protein BGN87_19610 [Rhizobiales bacterium 65-79]